MSQTRSRNIEQRPPGRETGLAPEEHAETPQGALELEEHGEQKDAQGEPESARMKADEKTPVEKSPGDEPGKEGLAPFDEAIVLDDYRATDAISALPEESCAIISVQEDFPAGGREEQQPPGREMDLALIEHGPGTPQGTLEPEKLGEQKDAQAEPEPAEMEAEKETASNAAKAVIAADRSDGSTIRLGTQKKEDLRPLAPDGFSVSKLTRQEPCPRPFSKKSPPNKIGKEGRTPFDEAIVLDDGELSAKNAISALPEESLAFAVAREHPSAGGREEPLAAEQETGLSLDEYVGTMQRALEPEVYGEREDLQDEPTELKAYRRTPAEKSPGDEPGREGFAPFDEAIVPGDYELPVTYAISALTEEALPFVSVKECPAAVGSEEPVEILAELRLEVVGDGPASGESGELKALILPDIDSASEMFLLEPGAEDRPEAGQRRSGSELTREICAEYVVEPTVMALTSLDQPRSGEDALTAGEGSAFQLATSSDHPDEGEIGDPETSLPGASERGVSDAVPPTFLQEESPAFEHGIVPHAAEHATEPLWHGILSHELLLTEQWVGEPERSYRGIHLDAVETELPVTCPSRRRSSY